MKMSANELSVKFITPFGALQTTGADLVWKLFLFIYSERIMSICILHCYRSRFIVENFSLKRKQMNASFVIPTTYVL